MKTPTLMDIVFWAVAGYAFGTLVGVVFCGLYLLGRWMLT